MTVQNAASLSKLEDLYLPYRPKRRTRATAWPAKRAWRPLASSSWPKRACAPAVEAAAYIDGSKKSRSATSEDDALAGARDIIAEWVAEDSRAAGAEMRATCSLRPSHDLQQPWPAGKRRPTAPNIGITSNGKNRPPRPRPTASWPCAAGSAEDILNLTGGPSRRRCPGAAGKSSFSSPAAAEDAEQVRLARSRQLPAAALPGHGNRTPPGPQGARRFARPSGSSPATCASC